MLYNFSQFFKDDELLLDEFLDKYTAHLDKNSDCCDILKGHYINILNIFSAPFEGQDILKRFENLAKYQILLEHPYIIITNEIYCLQSLMMQKMASTHSNTNLLQFLSLFSEVNNRVAKIYLREYIQKLLSINNIRINSISDLIDRNFIKHYESHLIWLTNLALSIKNEKLTTYPELDCTKCDFGKWLYGEAKSIIQNNSKLKTIETLHKSLHLFGKKIYENILSESYPVLVTYLEKCELFSLSIGTELALVDNILMNQRVTKDSLTGAMNRNGLKNVFESQYELSLATNNSFVIAMCDLDFFKDVNDTHGHVAGDLMLKMFVDTVKKYIRNSDIIIRYGGEEFIVMLPAITKAKGYEVLEKIRKGFEESSLRVDEKEIKATVSIGLLEIKPTNYYAQKFLNEYLNIVDKKLYIAKNTGRNRVEMD
ncbi:MAG: diguanylate cyclase [Helicobacteraceae bacterium CG2_30_36_10]|nr:MAG: diguanylate cyclase [Helicobacteraceae bacterium CG2_30_36_10]